MPPARVAADFGGLLRALRTGDVDFIVVEGVAGAAHGLARATYDQDLEAVAELEALREERDRS